MNTDTDAYSVTALEALAGALGRDEWVTVLTAHGPGHRPRLHVTSRTAPSLASDIYTEAGWYWWPHAQRIAPTSAPRHAAATLTRTILSTTPDEEHPATPTQAAGRASLPRRIPPDQPGRIPPDSPAETRQ